MSENRVGYLGRKRHHGKGRPDKNPVPKMQRATKAQTKSLPFHHGQAGRRMLVLPQLRMERRGIF
jgi:hypothetical protein